MSLAHTLATARFYGAKSEPIDAVRVVHSTPFHGDRLCLVEVDHGTATDTYQLLLDAEDTDVLGAHAVDLARTPAPLGTWHSVRDLPPITGGRQISGEQSNTSLILSTEAGDAVILKYFRKLAPGINPEVELLAGMGECPHVAPLYGWATAELDSGEATLAVAQEFVAGGQDGWRYALSLREAGQSFSREAHALGEATRSVHQALKEGFGDGELSATEVRNRLEVRLDDLTASVPLLAEYAPAARERYRALSGTTPSQRVHGDLHLGQSLRRPDGTWVLIDFEGEPARPLEERRRPDAAVRDVAGLLRSLDYAAEGAAEWSREASDALAEGYGVSMDDPFLAAYVLDKALYEVAYEANNRPDWLPIPRRAVERIVGS